MRRLFFPSIPKRVSYNRSSILLPHISIQESFVSRCFSFLVLLAAPSSRSDHAPPLSEDAMSKEPTRTRVEDKPGHAAEPATNQCKVNKAHIPRPGNGRFRYWRNTPSASTKDIALNGDLSSGPCNNEKQYDLCNCCGIT